MTSVGKTVAISLVVAVVLFLVVWFLEDVATSKVPNFLAAVIGFFISLSVAMLIEIQRVSWMLGTEASAKRVANPVLRGVAERALSDKNRILKEVKEQTVRCYSEKEMMDVYYDTFEHEPSGSRIDATSMVNIERIWKKARGKNALDANKKAVQRGVTVRRVFIFMDQDARDAASDYLKKHVAVGVKVHQVLKDALNEGLVLDFLVTGNGLSLEYETDGVGGLRSAQLSTLPTQSSHYKSTFQQIWAASEPFEGGA